MLQPVPTWQRRYFSLGKYRGFRVSLEHLNGESYKLVCSRASDFTKINSLPRTFRLTDAEGAIAFGKWLIDDELDFDLFSLEEPRHYLNECSSNLATLDTEDYYYDF